MYPFVLIILFSRMLLLFTNAFSEIRAFRYSISALLNEFKTTAKASSLGLAKPSTYFLTLASLSAKKPLDGLRLALLKMTLRN